jgi:hypothetical protein
MDSPAEAAPQQRRQPTLTRDNLIVALGCTHFELGRLLRERIAPLPVRLDGVILWFEDECRAAAARCQESVAYWRRRREQSAPKVAA